jgi:hypothetical protein
LTPPTSVSWTGRSCALPRSGFQSNARSSFRLRNASREATGASPRRNRAQRARSNIHAGNPKTIGSIIFGEMTAKDRLVDARQLATYVDADAISIPPPRRTSSSASTATDLELTQFMSDAVACDSITSRLRLDHELELAARRGSGSRDIGTDPADDELVHDLDQRKRRERSTTQFPPDGHVPGRRGRLRADIVCPTSTLMKLRILARTRGVLRPRHTSHNDEGSRGHSSRRERPHDGLGRSVRKG